MSDTANRKYDYPVYGTQGGGLVRSVGGQYIFVEKPDCPGLDVGDVMPEEWGVIPANQNARDEVDFNEGLDEFFEVLGDKHAAGEISSEEARPFFDRARRRP